jgi:hypothetical protein
MSDPTGNIECMFDHSLPEPGELPAVDDATLVGAITAWFRASAAAEARGYAAIAELARRRCSDDQDDRNWWPCDPWDSAAAEVAAALNVGHGRAKGRLDASVTLRDRLPKTNALFLAGALTAQMITTITWRTMLVTDDDALALLDAALADGATDWGPLSNDKLADAVDFWVNLFDRVAVRRTRTAARGRNLTIGDREDNDGTTSLWGRLLGTDATLLKRRLTAMATGVCTNDPRTLDQRHADALGALAAGADRLACGCDNPACPAAGDDGRAGSVVIHIVADHTALTAEPDPLIHGDTTTPAPPEPAATEAEGAAGSPRQDAHPAIGVIVGGGIVPTSLLAELIRNGATVRVVAQPGREAELHYRPSTTLREFVQTRDLTCRHPGCNRPAEFCDIDHTTAWPTGPTHPGNTKCLCRKHHLLKTWWTGAGGWSDEQLPDGTIIVTSPAGLTYRTRQGAALFFPHWNTVTPPQPQNGPPRAAKPAGNGLESFQRKHTRTQDRIQAERAHNAARINEQERPTY